MQQVIQEVRSGRTNVAEVLEPRPGRTQVLVGVMASAISTGTERFVVDLAKKSLLGKARQRPDHVRRILQKIRQEGLGATLTQVMAKLDDPMPLGYSAAGVVIECGRDVQQFKPGDRVAVAAPHAGVVSVGRNLCAHIPDNVSFEQAAYTSIASIALEGVRLAQPSLGDRVLVVGLGLVGQICVSLLKANGCAVFGTDVNPSRLGLATELGADRVGIGAPMDAVMEFSRGMGVDAVILTVATQSNGPIEFAAEACRTKGRIVLVGVTGLEIPREPFFKKELEFTVSSSLGPGRGDYSYEEKGIDYPVGHARWTAQRNMQAVLDTMAAGKLPVEKLTTHHFEIERATEAYELITSNKEPHLGIILQYPAPALQRVRRMELNPARTSSGRLGVSMIGAGNFAKLVLLPMLGNQQLEWRGLCTANGMSADHTGRKMDFFFVTTDMEEIFNDPQTQAVFVLTRHNMHADLVVRSLRAGKHVFVEKPLCTTAEDLAKITACVEELGENCPLLMVGFNRRFAPATADLQRFFAGNSPLTISYRFSPGYLPPDSWPQDPDSGGGRIIGEACHAIDTCVAITGSAPVKVYAESVAKPSSADTSDDSVFITLRHANGSVSNISYQAGGDRAFPPERIEVFGAQKVGLIDGWGHVELWSGGRRKRIQAKNDKGHRAELQSFLRACSEGGRWPIPWEHLRGTTWATLEALSSLREGGPQWTGETPDEI